MQLFTDVKQKVTDLVSENATTLLTAGGVVGTVTTAVLSYRAGLRSAEKLAEFDLVRLPNHAAGENEIIEVDPSMFQKAMKVWPEFIPPVLTGSATIGSIILANRMSAQKAAALAAAYGLAERQLGEYKAKVTEKLTGPKKQAIDDELAQDRVNKTDGYQQIVVVDGEVLCFDEPSGRYFRSTMENIKSAINATSGEIINHEYVRATFFYEELGLPATTWTDEVGWNRDHLPELKYSTCMSPDNRPCIAIDFTVLPKLDYVPNHY